MWWLEILGCLVFAMGWFPCCCDEGGSVTCSHCTTGTAPSQYQVVIASFADDNCTGCSGFNGTWALSYLGESAGQCGWRRSFSASGFEICIGTPPTHSCAAASSAFVEVVIAQDLAFNRYVNGSININVPSSSSQQYNWRNDKGTAVFDCGLSSEALTFRNKTTPSGSCYSCDPSSATFTVTAL